MDATSIYIIMARLARLTGLERAKMYGKLHSVLIWSLQKGMSLICRKPPTTNVSSLRDIENKRKHWKSKRDLENSIVTKNIASKKAFEKKLPRVNGDALQRGCALARQLNHDNPHWPKLVTDSGVTCQLRQWDNGETLFHRRKFAFCEM